MAWFERADFRGRIFKTWQDTLTGKFLTRFNSGTVLHYGAENNEVDFAPVRINNTVFDGWRIDASPWVYELGKDIENHGQEDGWVSFGMRAADRVRRFKFRLVRACWYHPPTQAVTFIGAAAGYNRANLAAQTIPLDISPEQNGSETFNTQSLAVWSNVLSGVNISWRSEGRGLKEEITVSAATRAAIPVPHTPASQTYFSFAFRIDAADVPRYMKNAILQSIEGMDDADGRIELWDAAENLLAFMPIDYAWSESNPSNKIRLRKRIFHHTDGNYYLLVGALASELNALPSGAIVFDPTFTDGYGGDATTYKDATITHADQNSNFGTANSLSTGAYSSEVYRHLIQFDLSSLDVDVTVDSATLTMTCIDSSVADNTIYWHRLIRAWVESQCTWNLAATGVSWDIGGCNNTTTDREAGYIGSATRSTGDSAGTQDVISLTAAAVQDWIDGTLTNNGLISTAANESTNSSGNYASSDHATTSYRPVLVVEYTAAGGGSVYDDAVTLARTAGISQLNNIIADAGISLARTNDSAPGNIITGEASLTLAQVLAIAQVAQADRAGSLSLPKNMTIAQASQLDANSALTLGTILTVGLIGGLNVEDALTLARTMDIAAVNIITKEDALTLARSLGITQITQLDAVGTLPLGKIVAVTQASQLEGVADLALARRLAAAFTNVANLNSAVSLGLSLSAVMVASVFSGGLVTPAARVYVIPSENRVVVIDAENRIYIIDAENRTFEI